MTAAAARGWCPSLMTPMASGDGLLVRVKPRAATLTADQAEAVAAAAQRYGNGAIDPTNRGQLQIRGLSDAGIDGFVRRMERAGLAAASPGGEAVRNVLADPLGPDDPAARFDSHRLAHRLSAILEDDPDLHRLPAKVDLLVDAGAALPLSGCTADISVRPGGGETAVIGLAGSNRALVRPVAAVEEAVRRLLAALLPGTGSGEAQTGAGGAARMKAMVAALGADGVFDAAGLHGGRRTAVPGAEAAGAVRPAAGFVPMAGGRTGFFLIGAPLGRLDAVRLAHLAGLARRFADGTIRMTPWKAVVLCGVSPSDAAALGSGAATAGLVADADDPRGRIVACAGRPACPAAEADTGAAAALLARTGLAGVPFLHVSGCAKGCAHPAAAPVTLTAAAGGYGLVRGGRAGDTPERTGLAPEAAAAAVAALEAAG